MGRIVDLMPAAEQTRLMAVLKAAQADPTRAPEYRRLRGEFALRWRPLVVWALNKWFARQNARRRDDDLSHEGFVALLVAVDHFDPAFGVKWSTYAANSILMHVRSALARDSLVIVRKSPRPESDKYAPKREAAWACRAGGHDLGWVAARDEAGPDLDAADRAARVAAMFGVMTAREAQAVRLLYGFDGESMSMAGAARAMGVSRERVRQLSRKVLGRLRGLGLDAEGAAA